MAKKDPDQELMRHALALAEKGDPSPNPHVGSLVASASGEVLGEGFHEATRAEPRRASTPSWLLASSAW
jgi:pyrimidine deaminase RibD-like protein